MKTLTLKNVSLLATSMLSCVQALPSPVDLKQSPAPLQHHPSDQSLSTEGMVHLFDAFTLKAPPNPEEATLSPLRLSPKQNVDLVCINDKSSLDQLEMLLSAKASGLTAGPPIPPSTPSSKKPSPEQVNSAVLKSCLKRQNEQYIPENFDVRCIEQHAITLASERQDAKEAVLEDLLSPKFNETSVAIIKELYEE
ncbi:hypothetical protein CP533_2063 [Ophiocordyceps camponoti-saundersi (nom. inval.)]|nr:hypothetical protein CP533_2063 [Ophiocordyceps camponoti-saundersi (nom. inval.)]